MKVLAALIAEPRSPGVYVLGPVTLDYPTNILTCAVSRASLPDTPDVLATLRLECHENGKWRRISEETLTGGMLHSRRGRLLLESLYTWDEPGEFAEGLEVRATLTVLSEFSASVELRAGEVPERLTTRGPHFPETKIEYD
jgi:hypothetical protein